MTQGLGRETVSTRREVSKDFPKDVRDHKMTVLLDQGTHRHLRFSKPGCSNHWFEIVTWPGCLSIGGDMGTWVFSRVEDMFRFFRSSGELRINPSYWSEKLQNGVHGGKDKCQEFSAELFKEEVLERLEGWDLSPEALVAVTSELEEEVFNQEYDSEHAYYSALYEFSSNGVQFDCEMPDGKQYGYHYLWCLHGIVWGIQQYDQLAMLPTDRLTIAGDS